MKEILIAILLVTITSCSTEAVKKKPVAKPEKVTKLPDVDTNARHVLTQDEERVLELDGGLKIHWVESGTGAELGNGQMAEIDYAVYLKNGKFAHSNKRLGIPSMPFMIGFNMQTKAWDLAFRHLKVGDSVEIEMPAKLARGKIGYHEIDADTGKKIEVIPPDTDLILQVRIIEERTPSRTVDGVKVWNLFGNKTDDPEFDETKEIEFQCNGYTPSKRNFVNTRFSMKLEDNGVVPGLKKALISSQRADKMFVYVPAEQAYGRKGLKGLVKPNEDIFYIIFVLDVK